MKFSTWLIQKRITDKEFLDDPLEYVHQFQNEHLMIRQKFRSSIRLRTENVGLPVPSIELPCLFHKYIGQSFDVIIEGFCPTCGEDND